MPSATASNVSTMPVRHHVVGDVLHVLGQHVVAAADERDRP